MDPFLPPLVVIVDRTDGTEWLLTHRQSDARIAINDAPIPPALQGFVTRYGPLEGPVMGAQPTVRLLIRDGRLGYEIVPLEQAVTDRDQPALLSRIGRDSYFLEITEGEFGGAFSWPWERLGWRSP